MSLPSGLVRIETRRVLLSRLAARLADDPDLADLLPDAEGQGGVVVLYRYHSKHPGRMVIAGDDVEGEVTITGFRGQQRQARKDSFDLKIVCAVGPNSIEVDVTDPLDPAGFGSMDTMVLRLVQLVEDEVANYPRLGAEEDPVIAEVLGSVSAQMAAIEGPNATETNEGPGSAAIVTVHCETHHR